MATKIRYFKIKYGSENRIVFTKGFVNPRKEFGKLGVRLYGPFGKLFKDTITIRAQEKDTKEVSELHLGKKSLIKWVNAHHPESAQLNIDAPQNEVIDRLDQIISSSFDSSDPISTSQHAGKPSKRPLRRFLDVLRGKYWNLFWGITLSSWTLFRLRVVLMSEKGLIKASEQRANAAFWDALKHVPAYKKHVENRKHFPKTFDQIPLTDKTNYLKPHINQHELDLTLKEGHLPLSAQCDTSTGTTGKPTMWLRGKEERQAIKTLLYYSACAAVGKKHFFFINAYALGPWTTGITTSNAFFEHAITFSPGPSLDKILDILEQFPPEKYPNYLYIIAGYPSIMKDLVEEARRKNFDLDRYKVLSSAGGEAMPDPVRQNILGLDNNGKKVKVGFDKIVACYGASDLDITIGSESLFVHALRKACKENSDLSNELFGINEPIPMIFHYDPLNYYIEADKDQNLIFTCCRADKTSPRIRYNLHDRGKTMPLSEVLATLQKHNIKITKPLSKFPLFFIWGREGSVLYYGFNIAIEVLQEAVQNVPSLKDRVQNCAFREREIDGKIRLSLLIELKQNVEMPSNQEEIRQALINQLKAINHDIRISMDIAPEHELPGLEIFSYGQSPMSKRDPHQKKRYIFD